MNFKTYLITTMVSAILFTCILLFLKVFKYISWSPIGWTKRYKIFQTEHTMVKWILLAIAISITILILLKLFSYTTRINPVFTSILIGLVLWGIIEWMIKGDFTFLKKSSLPFLAMVILFCRALVETSVFHQLAFHSGNRNKLPSQTDMIK
ncbi:MAG: hypothetical protein ACE3JQ_10080 [Paenisporosarcina sp.]